MKKLFKITSVILAVAMLCMLFVVPASAQAAGAAISLGLDAVVLPGETITIPVRVENMQEAAALEFTVDLDGLEFKEFVAGTWDAAALEENVAVNAAGDVKVASYFSDYVGTLFSIVATVPANAESTVSVNGAFAVDYDESEITVAGDTAKVTAFAVKYDGLALVMGETVDLKLYFVDNSSDIDADLRVICKENVEDEDILGNFAAQKNEAGEYFVKIPRYSFQMADDVFVTASYEVGGQNIAVVENKPVKVQDYFDAQKDKTGLNQKVVDCLYAMAKYGEVAATYFTTDEDSYAAPSYTNVNIAYQGGTITSSAAVDLSGLTKPEVDTTAVEVDENGAAVAEAYATILSDKRETLVLSSEICFKLYTKVDKTVAETYTYSYGTDLADLKPLSFDLMGGSYLDGENVYATIKVPVKAYESGKTFYVKAADTDGNTVAIVKYVAPDSYIARTWDLSEKDAYAKNNITLRTMLSALEVYGNSANAYYAAQ